MPDDNNHVTLTDAELFDLTKDSRRMFRPEDPIHTPPPPKKPAEEMTIEDFVDRINWKNR